jgi:hypothetical protein
MKIFLDDERTTPEGWHRTFTAQETIKLLENGNVTHLSLDHDLGPAEAGTGYDVVCFIEQKVIESGFNQTNPFIPPVMSIHSANPVGRQKMQLAIQMIYHHFKVTQPSLWEEFKKSL